MYGGTNKLGSVNINQVEPLQQDRTRSAEASTASHTMTNETEGIALFIDILL